MKFESLTAAALLGMATAHHGHAHSHARRGAIFKRQVPQEHSHEIYLTTVREFLNLNNPKGIQDPVFGLLGNAAAAVGAGQVTNLDCLKQETADQAFTNAKAAGDIRGMSAALVFQALERNTLGVGTASAPCNDPPVNPEIGAFPQHQDAAGEGAQAINKGIALELARQLALIGGDPLLALDSGTFNPGDLNDATGAGNSCDDLDDPVGCIFTKRLLFLDATPDEITAAVQGITPTFTGTGVLQATHVDFAGLNVAQVDTPVTPTPVAGGAAGGNAGGNIDNNAGGNAGNNTGNACNAPATGNAGNGTAVVAPPPATSSAAPATGNGAGAGTGAAATDFGSCSDPSIIFAAGLDGRKESAFAPNNKADFDHGSAQRIGIIASFICDRIGSSCKAPEATQQKCQEAAQAAGAAEQNQAAADTFNSILIGSGAAAAAGGGAAAGGAVNGNAGGAANDNAGADTCAARRRLRRRMAKRRLSPLDGPLRM